MERVLIFILIFMPIISDQPFYATIPTSIVYIGILSILFLLTLIKKIKGSSKHINIDKMYLVFIITLISCMLISTIINVEYTDVKNSAFGLINILTYFIIVFFSVVYVQEEKFYKLYYKVCLLLSCQILIQYFIFYIFSSRSNISLLGLNIFTDNLYQFYRPSGIFKEPSHFANYFVLVIFFELFLNKNIKKGIFFTLIVLMTTSGNAILLSAIIWTAYILVYINLKNLIVPLLVILTIANSNFILVDKIAERVKVGGTIGPRVYRGIEIQKTLDKNKKIFGVGVQNVSIYSAYYGVITQYDEVNARYTEFMSTIMYFFIATGLIGGSMFLIFLIILFLKSVLQSKVLILVFAALCYTSNVHTAYIWILYFFVIYKLNTNFISNTELRRV